MKTPEIHFEGDRATVIQGRQTAVTAALTEVMREITRVIEKAPSCGCLPDGVRLWRERGDAVGTVIEIPPQARIVRWLRDDSPSDFGPRARYGQYFLGFPYIELLLVFRHGALTGYQQLYYRRAPLETGEDLLLPNLYNVARGYGQRCWLCLENVHPLSELPWPEKIRAVVDHVFAAAFNRSAEVNEGNSYWSQMRSIDPRVASPEAWHEATRQNPRFPLEVAWRPAETTVSKELGAMLNSVVAPMTVHTAADLANAVVRASRRRVIAL